MRPLFSFEVPLKHLQDFDEDQDFIFSLSFLFKEKKYQEYLLRTSKAHVLDNSYNELGQPTDLSEMIALAKDYKAHFIISPDSDSWDPGKMLQSYAQAVAILGIDKVIGVARTLQEILALKNFKCKEIALPYEHRLCLPPQTIIDGTPIHFLGLNNIMEVFVYNPYSIDTSMPIKLALKNLTINEWILQGCPHIHTKDLIQTKDFFNLKLSIKELSLAKENIKTLKEILSYGQNFNGILHTNGKNPS